MVVLVFKLLCLWHCYSCYLVLLDLMVCIGLVGCFGLDWRVCWGCCDCISLLVGGW